MNSCHKPMLLMALILFPLTARSEEEVSDKVAEECRALVTKYLEAVKAKKWVDAKKWIHPKTFGVIAERKKRTGGKEEHPMAPWYYEKIEFYLKDFKVTGVKKGPVPMTYIVDTSEDNFQVVEKGVAEGDTASYLVGKWKGRWYVVDKKRGETTFTRDSVKFGYKGYFDPPDKSESGESAQ